MQQYKKYEELVAEPNENNVNIWEESKEKTEQELKDENWTTLNGLVLRLTPYNSIPGMFI